MNKMNFHEFFEYFWEDELLEIIISTKYLEDNQEFIRNYTLDLFRLYDMDPNIEPRYFKKMIEITFSNLFAYQPGTENIREISDKYRNSHIG